MTWIGYMKLQLVLFSSTASLTPQPLPASSSYTVPSLGHILLCQFWCHETPFQISNRFSLHDITHTLTVPTGKLIDSIFSFSLIRDSVLQLVKIFWNVFVALNFVFSLTISMDVNYHFLPTLFHKWQHNTCTICCSQTSVIIIVYIALISVPLLQWNRIIH